MEVILLGAMCMYSTVRYDQKHHCLFIVLSFSFNFMVLIVYRKFLDFYFQLIVSYFQPTIILCTARPWLRHIGFVLVYGPLALKTWRQELLRSAPYFFTLMRLFHSHTNPSPAGISSEVP